MARNDLRWRIGTSSHPKVVRMIAACGERSFRALSTLWEWVALNRPDGVLRGMDALDVAIAAGWVDAPSAFVTTLCDVRLLDGKPGKWSIHDWADEQPWVVHAEERSASARHAARMRWGCGTDTDRMRPASIPQCGTDAESENRNAPTPTPTPIPNPTPTPTPTPEDTYLIAGEAPAPAVVKAKPVVGPQDAAARRLATALGSSLNPCRKQVAALVARGATLDSIDAAVIRFAEPGMAPWDWTKKVTGTGSASAQALTGDQIREIARRQREQESA